MGGEEGNFNGDGMKSIDAGYCSKGEALPNGLNDAGEGSSGASEGLRTYKRRKQAMSCSDSKDHEDGRTSTDAASKMADQIRWRNVVLEHIYQSLSDEEGGIQGCIRDALVFHLETDCTATVKESYTSDEDKHKSSSQTMRMHNGFPNGSQFAAKGHVDLLPNGPLLASNYCTVTAKCQRAFFNIVISENFTLLCKLLFENFQGTRADSLFDLKVINSRMKDGSYEHSPMLFSTDIQTVWKKLQDIGTEMTSLAKNLSDMSTNFYNEQFCSREFDINAKQEQTEGCGVDNVCTCRHCGEKADGKDCLVCDSCEEIYHVSCIEPAVKKIPSKSWYCASCTANGIGSPHENCVVCERLNAPGTTMDQGGNEFGPANEEILNDGKENSHCSTDDVLQLSEESKNLCACRICGSELGKGEKFRICDHSFCPNKYYHVRCLTMKQLKSYGPHWYCPSCLCRACLTDRDDDKIVLCDGCDNAYHLYCMSPPKNSIPKGKWFCKKCDDGIQRIHKVKRALKKIENSQKKEGESQKKEGEDSKTMYGNHEMELKDKGEEESNKGRGMDMLLNAAKTLNYEENLAAIHMKS
ncbi:PHD domain-containing protein [Cephalotus follicularis]|uniref:PHD domain-containing protein n=1 Tax=Cephalotus follicularis TaxID=3775 RepID=A0A1Q3CJX9_CEPFO|nr:PHD domain-containing protein [Cephalotus follicularis]